MSSPIRHGSPSNEAAPVAQLEIVVPVHNEARQLAASVTSLRRFLDSSFPVATAITVVDNASTDDTWPIATGLAASLPGVSALHLDQKGRGRALRAAWSAGTAPVVAYMDVDLATGLEALLPLVAPLLSGHSDVAIGTRLAPGAHVVRGARREVISRSYNLLLRWVLANPGTDAQCGFKALRREAADILLPLVEDEAWFFDTELLVTARRLGLRIHEVPVDWVDDLDSRVAVARTAWLDICGVARLSRPSVRRRVARVRRTHASLFDPANIGPDTASDLEVTSRPVRPARTGGSPAGDDVFADELLRFAGVGVVSTLAYLLLFAGLRPWMDIYVANVVAVVACGIGNTAAHRGMAGSARHGLHRSDRTLVAAALLGVSMGATTLSLVAVRAVGGTSLLPELAAVTVANLAAAAFRFAILRTWVFRPQFGTHVPGPVVTTGTAGSPPDAAPPERVGTVGPSVPVRRTIRVSR